MKKITSIILLAIFTLAVTGCSNNGGSITEKIKKAGFEEQCKDKKCIIKKNDDDFVLTKSTDNEILFMFSSLEDDYYISYFPDDDNYVIFPLSEDGEECVITGGVHSGSDCNDVELEFATSTKNKYNDYLENIGVSEKELYDYLNELYNDNFI